jgi:A/G-specific adenine glycosylase
MIGIIQCKKKRKTVVQYPHMISEQQIFKFQQHILDWYAHNQRDLPWRRTRDPYHILLSEVMLQQTQVQRVMPKFEAWLKRFPTILSVAHASVADVLALWSGLGYNRRVLNFKKTAETICTQYNGIFPKTEKELLSLPGIGLYTARAVLCFAFNQQVAVVDTNVRKVILTQVKGEEKDMQQIAEQLLPAGRAYEWNQALMDYSSAMLKEHKIPIPKQSRFIGSHRYYRGRVLKALLKTKLLSINDIGRLIKEDYANTNEEKVWLQNLLQALSREGFIVINGDLLTLVS